MILATFLYLFNFFMQKDTCALTPPFCPHVHYFILHHMGNKDKLHSLSSSYVACIAFLCCMYRNRGNIVFSTYCAFEFFFLIVRIIGLYCVAGIEIVRDKEKWNISLVFNRRYINSQMSRENGEE